MTEWLYLIIRPPPDQRRQLDARRRMLGLDRSYGAERFNLTAQPFGAIDRLTPAKRAALIAAITALAIDAAPFRIVLDRVAGRQLIAGDGAAAIARLRRAVAASLAPVIAVPRYGGRPHVSLAYHGPRRAPAPVDAVAWTVREVRLIGSLLGHGRHIDYAALPFRPRQGELFGSLGDRAGQLPGRSSR